MTWLLQKIPHRNIKIALRLNQYYRAELRRYFYLFIWTVVWKPVCGGGSVSQYTTLSSVVVNNGCR